MKLKIIALTLLFLLAACSNADNHKLSDAEMSNLPKEREQKKDREVTIVQNEISKYTERDDYQVLMVRVPEVLQEYEENAVAADRKYKGRSILVRGYIETIKRGSFDGKMYVEMKEEANHIVPTLVCHFGEQELEVVSSLKKGEYLTVLGQFKTTGASFGMGIDLRNCKVMKKE